MPFAVEMYLDPVGEAKVRSLWQDLADAHLLTNPPAAAVRPHVSLTAYAHLDVEACQRAMAEFARAEPVRSVHFRSIGVFAANPDVVFLAPVVTADLVDLHHRFYQQFRGPAGEPVTYHLPGHWVPHCTLALGVPRSQTPTVLERCLSFPLPLEARLVEVGLIEFPQFRRRAVFPFEAP